MEIIAFIISIGLSILVGDYAVNYKNRSFWVFFTLSIFLSPIIGFLIALIIPEKGRKVCPLCKELIKGNALRCKYCGNENFTINEVVPVK